MAKIDKVLVPVDFSSHSRDAVNVALAFKNDFGAKVILLHVFDITELLGLGWTIYGESLESESVMRMEEDSRKHLNDFVDELQIHGDEVEQRVSRGKPFVETVQVARAEKVDMIIMGTHGRKGISHLLMGSNAEKVVHKAPCSVMTVQHKEGQPAKPLPAKTILVPTDFSLTSERAMSMAVKIADVYSSKIILLHVVDDFRLGETISWTSYVTAPKSQEEMGDAITKLAFEELEAFKQKFPVGDISVEPRVVEDNPHRGIVSLAEEEKIDLIVMGTHGRTGISHLLMGSNAEKAVRTAPCPVLTVKPRDYVFEMP